MRYVKIGAGMLAIALIGVQFVRPEKNLSDALPAAGITSRFPVPDTVLRILRRSCFDCHSDNTVYPWYASVEPVGWWLNSHIRDGKRNLDFDEFASYRPMRQFIKFRQIVSQIQRDEMPLPSYLLIHRYAVLSAAEKDTLLQWARAMMDTMKARYPADSLERRPPPGPEGRRGMRDGRPESN